MTFSTKEEVHLPSAIHYAMSITTTRTIETDKGDVEEVECTDLLVWLQNRSLWLIHLTEDIDNHMISERVHQIVVSNRRDATTIQTAYVIPDYLLFLTGNYQTVFHFSRLFCLGLVSLPRVGAVVLAGSFTVGESGVGVFL